MGSMHGATPHRYGVKRIDSSSGSLPVGQDALPATVGSRQSLRPANAASLSCFRNAVAAVPSKFHGDPVLHV